MIITRSNLILFLIAVPICLPACGPSPLPIQEDIKDIESLSSPDTYEADCHRTQYWFCPPHNAIWQRPVVVDICVDPPQVISTGECEELFECDPSIFLQGEEACFTLEGYPGKRKKYCNKGTFQYGECISPCSEEICDGKDNNCDGQIDEGQTNLCGGCGSPPQEICDGVDNDCNGQTDEDLVQECSTDCGVGIEYCEDGNWVSCTAQVPVDEICDGLDNNCNGQIDEGLDCACTVKDVGTLFPCTEPPLLCGEGFKTCVCEDPDCTSIITTPCYAACHYFPTNEACDPYAGAPKEEEECNNFDDNCNHLIDEDLFSACYTGESGTLNVGICQAGEVYCNQGVWGSDKDGLFHPNLCAGEIVPEDKDNCNGVDDNCDGIVDEGKELQETDIVFILDWSGSMDMEIAAVSQALGLFAKNYSDEEVILWSLIKGPFIKTFKEELHLITDLTSFSVFSVKISVAVNLSQTGSKEMLGDALYLILHDISGSPAYQDKFGFKWKGSIKSYPEIDKFSVSWRENTNKVIIVFTDEPFQTFMKPSISIQNVLSTAAGVPNLKIYVFTPPVYEAKETWGEVATGTGGKWFELTYDVLPMYHDLIDILDENICE